MMTFKFNFAKCNVISTLVLGKGGIFGHLTKYLIKNSGNVWDTSANLQPKQLVELALILDP